MIEEGQKFPDFQLSDQDGNQLGLSDLAGQQAVIYFYPKDDTSGCTVEACEFRDMMPEIKGARVIGVSPDDEKSHRKFIAKHNLNFTLLADLGHICERSKLAADVRSDAIPRSRTLVRYAATQAGQQALLAGGDDYELCFTAAPRARARLAEIAERIGLPLTRIGTMRRGRGVRLLAGDGRRIAVAKFGFDHFA